MGVPDISKAIEGVMAFKINTEVRVEEFGAMLDMLWQMSCLPKGEFDYERLKARVNQLADLEKQYKQKHPDDFKKKEDPPKDPPAPIVVPTPEELKAQEEKKLKDEMEKLKSQGDKTNDGKKAKTSG